MPTKPTSEQFKKCAPFKKLSNDASMLYDQLNFELDEEIKNPAEGNFEEHCLFSGDLFGELLDSDKFSAAMNSLQELIDSGDATDECLKAIDPFMNHLIAIDIIIKGIILVNEISGESKEKYSKCLKKPDATINPFP